MKKCPNCGQAFSDDSIFCVNDGATLVFDNIFAQAAAKTPDSQETQVLPQSSGFSSTQKRNTSGAFYFLIGALAAVVICMGAGFYFLRHLISQKTSEDSGYTNVKSEINSSGSNQTSVNAGEYPPEDANRASLAKANVKVNSQNAVRNDRVEAGNIAIEAQRTPAAVGNRISSGSGSSFEPDGKTRRFPTPLPTVNAPKIVSKGVVNGSAISLPKPAYPPTAKAVGASGAVNVQVLIDENGNVISASAVSGHPLLRAVSAQAARGAKFKPTLLSGTPVKVSGIIVYNFQ